MDIRFSFNQQQFAGKLHKLHAIHPFYGLMEQLGIGLKDISKLFLDKDLGHFLNSVSNVLDQLQAFFLSTKMTDTK